MFVFPQHPGTALFGGVAPAPALLPAPARAAPQGDGPPPLLPLTGSGQPWRRRVNASIMKRILNIKGERRGEPGCGSVYRLGTATRYVPNIRVSHSHQRCASFARYSRQVCPLPPLARLCNLHPTCRAAAQPAAAKLLQQRFGWHPNHGLPRMAISVNGQLLEADPGPNGEAAAVMEFNTEGRDGFPFKVGERTAYSLLVLHMYCQYTASALSTENAV